MMLQKAVDLMAVRKYLEGFVSLRSSNVIALNSPEAVLVRLRRSTHP